MFGKKVVAMLLAEFIGVAVLAMSVYTIAARTSFPLFTGLAAGGVVALFSLVAGAVSGAHLNPAITFGLWTIRKVTTLKAIMLITAQILGGLAAWLLLKYFIGHTLTSIAGTFEWKIFTAEAIGAGVFGFGVAAAVIQKMEAGRMAATIGASLFIGVLVASLASNAVLNPAVALGIRSWNRAYAVAPLAGTFVGMNLYSMFFNFSSDKRAVASTTVVEAPKTVKAAKKKASSKKKK